jgi:hypothetical protein
MKPVKREKKVMKKTLQLTVFALAAGWISPALAQDYVVIVNASNSYKDSVDKMKEDIKRIFLKKQGDWPTGVKAVPLVPESSDTAYTSFLNSVVGMDVAAVDAYWNKRKLADGETPPRSIGSSSILFRQVGRKKGAFGIVRKDDAASAPDTVKVLFEF